MSRACRRDSKRGAALASMSMQPETRHASDRRFDFAVLALGVLAVSTAAPFIREADAPALTIAAYRLLLATVPLAALSAYLKLTSAVKPATETKEGRAGLVLLTVASGICLAPACPRR